MLVEQGQVLRCEKCGNIAVLLQGGGPLLHCCNKPMILLVENTTDAAVEKHVPVVEKTAGGFSVKVGDTDHPMGDDHWIQWIELIADGRSYFRFLDPGQEPAADFALEADTVEARAYCNLHGQWKA